MECRCRARPKRAPNPTKPASWQEPSECKGKSTSLRPSITPEVPVKSVPTKEELDNLELGEARTHPSGFWDPWSCAEEYLFTILREELHRVHAMVDGGSPAILFSLNSNSSCKQEIKVPGLYKTHDNHLPIQLVGSRPSDQPTKWYYSDYVGMEIEGYL